jgi:hypothetical protein
MENRASTRNVYLRGVVCRVLHLFLGFALLNGVAFSQDSGQTGKTAIHRIPRPVIMPYIAEYSITDVLIESGAPVQPKGTTLHVQDSQGRSLEGSLNAFSDFTVTDPVDGRMIFWDTHHTEAKLLEYATPVRGRGSCWQAAPEDKFPRSSASCRPAEQFQSLMFACRNEVVDDAPLTQEWLPAQATYQDCELFFFAIPGTLEKKVEDLGTDTIQGFEAHGCRSTTESSSGTLIREYWAIKFGEEKFHILLKARETTLSPYSGKQTQKQTKELTRLEVGEPDPSVFEPPKDYTVKTAVMHEVPCPGSSTQSAGTTPSQ